ncbi:Fur-regulated basic protein FbpA [Halobacillus shinanisalinarum]|uniref:Fur-regulated basic protein FbpA n=1 Tax=Halobacillus shinanisalinarum TaxID=2932258 RepID=A0ABY4H427_9BACI|nr:Fur-regulated basic protein FbpA [Halobacillus shinanisalinarum]UOQ94923.1 Fur-regulated basic protein FbpA [Halobacillus shinanisalinarum]
MRNHLREAVEEMRQHYIQKLLDANVRNDLDKDPSSFTLSELENIVKFYRL